MKNNYTTKSPDLQEVLRASTGREVEILQRVAGINSELLDGKHHPCPKCGGRDRFRLIDKSKGAVFCNQCFRENNGDFIAAVQWIRGVSFPEALRLIAEYLGIRSNSFPSTAVKPKHHNTPKANTQSPKGTSQKSPPKPKAKLLRTIQYEYVNGAGDYHALVERFEFADGTKSFRQSRWNSDQQRYVSFTGCMDGVPAIPYDAPSFKEATTIYWTDGEKAATHLAQVMEGRKPDVCCSCNWGCCKNFPNELVVWFRDKSVIIFADNDEAGAKYARRVASAVSGIAKSVKIVSFPEYSAKYDIADWLGEEV